MEIDMKNVSEEYKNNIIYEFTKNHKEYNLRFSIAGEPINYVRERKGRNKTGCKGHFYNPKENIMNDFKVKCSKLLSIDTKDTLKKLYSDPKNIYYIKLEVIYYKAIQQSGSKNTKILKELGIIKPNSRPDLDNYDKFLLDSLHDVIYDDDKDVIEISSKKLYSFNPRTDIVANITAYTYITD